MDMETGGHDVEALANLWPVDVPFCSQYAAHILHAKGLGCVEVKALPLTTSSGHVTQCRFGVQQSFMTSGLSDSL